MKRNPVVLFQWAVSVLLLIVGASCMSVRPGWQPAPKASNSFYILPIFDALMFAKTTEEMICREADKLLAQCGKGNRYHRVGFSFIYPKGDPETVRRVCRIAKAKGIVLGLIVARQTHDNPVVEKLFVSDLRNYQWCSDGENWMPDKKRDAKEPGDCEVNNLCSSRYCDPVRAKSEILARQDAREINALMKEFPGVIVVVNPLIEESLAGWIRTNKTEYYTDCSPYAVTEFRDWLRHAGRYDAANGGYKGQGASAEIVGQLVRIGGRCRSQFYDDPDPAHSGGTGKSFNEVFGTSFTTWSLRYWDLERFPQAMTDKANLMPKSGQGYVAGGFDVPRIRDDGGAYWRAWNWTYQDQKGFPPGDDKKPAYGFRQWQIRNFVNDFFGWLIDEGLPRDILYAHQVPCEALGESEIAVKQSRGFGQTVWSGWVPACGTVGLTRFGPIDVKLPRRYSDNWGIFEWHPAPGARPDEKRLYDSAMRDFNVYYTNGCHILFPGWWKADGRHDPTFPMNDSRLTDAIRDFMASRPDKPCLTGP